MASITFKDSPIITIGKLPEINTMAPDFQLIKIDLSDATLNDVIGNWIFYEIDPAALEKCGEFLSSVCTCGCKGTGKFRETELNNAEDEDKVALLKKFEGELEEELKKVRSQIEELKKEPQFFLIYKFSIYLFT